MRRLPTDTVTPMMRWPQSLVLVSALLLAACYASHGRGDGSADAGGPLPDVRDSSAHDRDGGDIGPDGSSPPDAGFDLRSCSAPGTPLCYCWAEDPTDPNGRCITPYGDEDVEGCTIGMGCAEPGWFCNDLGGGALRGQSRFGICVPREACLWLRSIESRAVCFYEDGTPFDTGVISPMACTATERGVLCGPECGACDARDTCVGSSERSGLGICALGPSPSSPDRCGSGFAECGPGEACLGFVLPDDVTTVDPARVWHSCVPREDCTAIAARYPERFRCEP